MQYVNVVLYAGLGALCFAQWRRRRTASARWLALCFGALGAAVVVSLAIPDMPETFAEESLVKLVILLIAAYPFTIYRFGAFFRPPSKTLDRAVTVSAVAVAGWAVLLPEIPSEGEERSSAFQLFAVAFILHWVAASMITAWRLWRGSRGLPGVARRRAQVLGLGAFLLALILLPGSTGEEQTGAFRTVLDLMGIAAPVFFYLGFAPPGVLRTVWRRHDQSELRRVELGMLRLYSPEEVAAALLPHVKRLMGGRGAVILDSAGEVLAVDGFDEERVEVIRTSLIGTDARPGAFTELAPSQKVYALSLRNGAFVVEASSFTPFFGEEEVGLLRGIGNFADLLFERIQALDREKEARAAQERTNAELETLVYGISHDLKSPLVSLLGYLELLGHDYGSLLDEQGQMFLRRMTSSGTYMQALISDLLELSRVGRVQTETSEVDVTSTVEELAAGLRTEHPKVSFDVGALPRFWANPLRVRQLFANLLTNAVDHGGRADLSVRVASEKASDGSVVITVADDGVGVPAEYRERIFGIFERLEGVDTERSGTGIGLALCRKIAESFGGTLSLQVTDGPGACFRLELPASVVRGSASPVAVPV